MDILKLIDDLFQDKFVITKDIAKKWFLDNQWKVADCYEKDCQKSDLIAELQENDIDVKKLLTENENLFDNILYFYRDKLNDSEEWHFILNETINSYADDLEKYKNKEVKTENA